MKRGSLQKMVSNFLHVVNNMYIAVDYYDLLPTSFPPPSPALSLPPPPSLPPTEVSLHVNNKAGLYPDLSTNSLQSSMPYVHVSHQLLHVYMFSMLY